MNIITMHLTIYTVMHHIKFSYNELGTIHHCIISNCDEEYTQRNYLIDIAPTRNSD